MVMSTSQMQSAVVNTLSRLSMSVEQKMTNLWIGMSNPSKGFEEASQNAGPFDVQQR